MILRQLNVFGNSNPYSQQPLITIMPHFAIHDLRNHLVPDQRHVGLGEWKGL